MLPFERERDTQADHRPITTVQQTHVSRSRGGDQRPWVRLPQLCASSLEWRLDGLYQELGHHYTWLPPHHILPAIFTVIRLPDRIRDERDDTNGRRSSDERSHGNDGFGFPSLRNRTEWERGDGVARKRVSKKQCGGVYFCLYSIACWKQITPPELLYSVFAGWRHHTNIF